MGQNVIEALESRQLFAAGILLTDNAGDLSLAVETGNKADTINILKTTFQMSTDPIGTHTLFLSVTVNARTESYTFNEVDGENRLKAITVNSSGGNDDIQVVSDSTGYNTLIEVDAGNGNDSVFLATGFATANGGAGNDVITGVASGAPAVEGSFAFSLRGGTGNDVLVGSKYSDAFNGDAGNDLILADDGDDYIQFGQGVDLVLAGNGDDYMVKDYDDRSPSIILGGAGNDTLAVFTGGQQLPLNRTFSRLRICGVELFQIDNRG